MTDLAASVSLFGLVFSRVGGLFALAPIFGSYWIPMTVRVALALVVSGILLPIVSGNSAVPTDDAAYFLAMGREMLIGLATGFLAQLVFAAVQMAGQLLDLEMGFSMVEVANPALSGQSLPVTGNLLYMLALMLLLGTNGHHVLLRGLAASLEQLPPGTFVVGGSSTRFIAAEFSSMFYAAVSLALPVLGALFLSTVLLGVLARAVPQINVFITGLPLKIAVGISVLVVIAPIFVQQLQGHIGHVGEAIANLIGTFEEVR